MKILNKYKNIKIALSAFTIMAFCIACGDIDKFELPEAGSIEDVTPPSANFGYSQGEEENFLMYTFSNLSSSATMYAWDFGDGDTSTDKEPNHTYPSEGMYAVSLTASDALGVNSTYTETIDVVKPEAPETPDPVLVNADFDKLPKSSGSDCACSAWINKSIGDQGESSSGNGGSDNVLKFDNNEPDIIYQEFEITPNADYSIAVVTSFKNLETGGTFPSMLELRVLAGAGYKSDYTPVYYAEAVEFPQDDWGYNSVAQVEDAANNLLIEVQSNPSDDGYITYTYTFNAGANSSAALFIRGIGGPATGGGGGDFGFNSGDEEIRIDNVTITAIQ